MFQSRRIGAATLTRVLEYSGPTHDPLFLFPAFQEDVVQANPWLAPHHWVPAMRKFVVTLQLWVVQAGGNTIVVDTGVGNFKPRPHVPRMDRLNNLVLPWLHAAGIPRESVTHVVLTHLHGDHVGWNTLWEDERWVPTFPNARYLAPREDMRYFRRAYEENPQRNLAYEDSVQPIVREGLLELFDPGEELAGCLAVEAAPGHTPGQVNFRLRSEGEEALFCGDVMHNAIQIAHPQWNSGYCLAGDTAFATRMAVLERAQRRGALIVPAHFGAPYCGYVRREGPGYAFAPAPW